jgi:hypothetical protein
MRSLLIPTLLLIAGCAHDTGLQVVGSIYCETDRPEGKAVAKVELRYTPPVDEHNHSEVPARNRVASARPANPDAQKESDAKPATVTTTGSKATTRDVSPESLKKLAEDLAATAVRKAITECQE